MKLILTRHGETIENIQNILQGQTQGTLSPTGKKQAKQLAKRLKNEKIDYIFSSDLKRVKDTTKEIIKYHPNTKVDFVKELREQNLGEFQGKTKEEVKWDSKTLKGLKEPKNAESLEEFSKRVSSFLDKIITEYNDKNILFVSHGGVTKILIAYIMKEKLENIERIKNTSVSIFEIDKNKNYKTIILNSVEHLEGFK